MALPPPDIHSTCLVTGASSGIGAEAARALARRGHGVTLVARRADRMEELATELRSDCGIRVEVLECDLADDAARERMLTELAELAVSVEVLVNNAGFGTGGLFHELDAEREVRMVHLNVEVLVALTARFVPDMVRRKRGGVLNVASTAAFQPLPRQATYGATKAFVLSFTDALHAELAGTGVAATALCPGPVRTEFPEVAGIGEEADNLPDVFWAEAPEVAEQGIRGLERNRRVVVPGLLNRAGALGGQHAPRGALLKLASKISPVGR
jgi:short-subunit dehydrogenase